MSTPQERLAEQLEQILMNRIENDNLDLPTMPQMAAKCLSFTRNPSFSVDEAARIVEKDPVLAAELIRAANSAANATREPASNIQTAISRLGIQKLRTVVISVSTRKVFESRDKRIVEACRGLWDHSQAVAALARDVAVVSGCGDPEEAFLAGLLHDVGKPVVATMLLDAETAILSKSVKGWIESNAWITIVQNTHRKIGVAVGKRWQMPKAVVQGIEECDEYDADDRQSTSNAVRFANALAKREGIYVGPVDTNDADALLLVGRSLLDIDDEAFERLVQFVQERRWLQ